MEKQNQSVEVDSIPLKPISNPKVVGGNVVVEVDAEEYKRGVENLKFSVIGRLSVHRDDSLPTTMEVKEKLVEGLKIEDMKVIAMGKGVFHIILSCLNDQCKALTAGSLFLKPGILRFSRWLPGFTTSKQFQTNTQVWIRVYNLPLEF